MKYLGVVDGSMGILSRKMALDGCDTIKPLLTVDTQKVDQRTKQQLGRNKINLAPTSTADLIKPVLGHKNYSKRREE